jgi:hypothetical protein
MKFWNYPATGTGSFSYSDMVSAGYGRTDGTLSANFGATTYNWTSMPNSISAVNADIATLMYQCGVSVAMDVIARQEAERGYCSLKQAQAILVLNMLMPTTSNIMAVLCRG